MDLLQTVRKEGSRGGVNFTWDDVKNSAHRENYLGHSLMAPVGRWQKNKDLGWYAKAEDAELTPEQRAEKERERKRDEMKKIKEAEEDAMARALGLPVPDRSNANLEPLGVDQSTQSEMQKALREALGDGSDDNGTGTGAERERFDNSGRKNMRRSRETWRHDRNDGGARRRSHSREREHRHQHRHRRHSPRRSRSRSRERGHRRSRSRDHKEHKDRRHSQRGYDGRTTREGRDRRKGRSRTRSRSPKRWTRDDRNNRP